MLFLDVPGILRGADGNPVIYLNKVSVINLYLPICNMHKMKKVCSCIKGFAFVSGLTNLENDINMHYKISVFNHFGQCFKSYFIKELICLGPQTHIWS